MVGAVAVETDAVELREGEREGLGDAACVPVREGPVQQLRA